MKKLLLLLSLFLVSVETFAGIPLSTNFTVNTALPIEDRMSVADTTARDALSSLRRWEGMLVYVVADGKHYTLIGGITNGDWTELSGGGGGNLALWATATPYLIGATVIESNKIYYALTNHTSGTFATDLANNDWVELSESQTVNPGLLSFIFSASASDIATYYQAPSISSYSVGALTTVPTVVGTSATLMGSFATNIGFPNVTSIPAGFFIAHYDTDKVSGANNYYTYFEVYKRASGGTETLLATSDQTSQTAVNTVVQQSASAIIVSPITLLATDRIIVKVYGVLLSSSATVDLLFDDSTNARIELPSATVDATNFVPYTGATQNLNLGTKTISASNLTITDKLIGAYQTPSNLLNNGDVELTDITPITCTTGTCTRTTTSGEFSQGTAALKVVPAANVLDASWIATTPLGIQKQGFARVIYKVPSTCSTTFVVRTMVDGATQTEVPTSKLIMDNTFRSIEVPLTFGSTSAGIKVYANGTCTGDTFFDGAILSQGLGLQNLSLDTDWATYTPTFTGLGTVSPASNQCKWKTEGDDLLVSCRLTSHTPAASLVSITLPNNLIIDTSKILIANTTAQTGQSIGTWNQDALGGYGSILTATGTSSALVYIGQYISAANQLIPQNGSSSMVNSPTMFRFRVPVVGKSSSANVYSQASGNYSRRSYTPTFTGFGTTSSVSCYESRENEYVNIDCSFISGTTTATEARVSLPNNIISTANITQRLAGQYVRNNSSNDKGGSIIIEPSVGYVTFSSTAVFGQSSVNATTKVNGTDITVSGSTVNFHARIPIAGWTNSSAIVGSFAGYTADSNIPTASYWVSTSFAASTTIPINFDSKEWDSHNAVTTSATAWKFTAPVSGVYSLSGFISGNVAAVHYFQIYKNGSAYKAMASFGSAFNSGAFSTSVRLNQGDYIDIRPPAANTVSGGALNANSAMTNIVITKTVTY